MNSDYFRGPEFQSGYDHLWFDLWGKHVEQPFHLLVGGGDQLYCDGCVIQANLRWAGAGILFRVAQEPELQEWINHPNREEKMHYPLTQEMLGAIDRYYFNHYCRTFGREAYARANSSMCVCPNLNLAGLIIRAIRKPYVEHARSAYALSPFRAV